MARAVVLGGDAAALELFSNLVDVGVEATLVLCEPLEDDVVPKALDDGSDAAFVEAKAVRVLISGDRVAGLLVHTDADSLSALPGAVALAGHRPTRPWTGEGGLGHGLALGILAGADATGLDDLDGDGAPRGGLVADARGATRVDGLFALGGAVPRGAEADPGDVAEALTATASPGSLPTPALPDVDRSMPEGFAQPKLERLSGILEEIIDDGDAESLTRAERQVRGLYGEMRSYLQARRSEELLDLRDAVVVALAVVRSLAERASGTK